MQAKVFLVLLFSFTMAPQVWSEPQVASNEAEASDTEKSAESGVDPNELFEALFAEQIKTVESTRDPRDDAKLAGEMIASTKIASDHPDVLLLICDKVIELGSRHADGYSHVFKAADIASLAIPEKRAEILTEVLPVRHREFDQSDIDQKPQVGATLIDDYLLFVDDRIAQADFTTANRYLLLAISVANVIKSDKRSDIQAKLLEVRNIQRLYNQVEMNERLLASNPDNKVVQEKLMRLHLIDFDQPAKAIPYVKAVGSESEKRLVPLAAQPLSKLSAPDMLALGEYYRSLASDASTSKAAMLTRAYHYFSGYINAPSDQINELELTKARLFLKMVDDELKTMGVFPFKKSILTYNLLGTGDIAYAQRGEWLRKHSSLVHEEKYRQAILPFPRTTKGSYTLSTTLLRPKEGGTTIITFPVGEDNASLVLEWGTRTGLYTTAGIRSSSLDDEMGTEFRIPIDRSFEVIIDVTVEPDKAMVKAIADGKLIADYSGPSNQLRSALSYDLHPRAFSIMARSGPITLEKMELRINDGKLEIIELPKREVVNENNDVAEESDPHARAILNNLMQLTRAQAYQTARQLNGESRDRLAKEIGRLSPEDRRKVIRHTGIYP